MAHWSERHWHQKVPYAKNVHRGDGVLHAQLIRHIHRRFPNNQAIPGSRVLHDFSDPYSGDNTNSSLTTEASYWFLFFQKDSKRVLYLPIHLHWRVVIDHLLLVHIFRPLGA